MEALEAGLRSSDVVLNALSRQRQPAALPRIAELDALTLQLQPAADCVLQHIEEAASWNAM